MRRRLRRIATWLVVASVSTLLLGVAALELAYQILLPEPLPKRAQPLPDPVRNALWLDSHSTLPPEWPFAYPFLLSVLLTEDVSGFSLPGHVARLHIVSLQERGVIRRERHLRRILRELALATWIVRHWTAEDTLDALGAHVYVGDGLSGLPNASRHYFGKDVRAVSLDELALLAALIRSPHALHPACHPDRALAARNSMLERMAKALVLDSDVLLSAKAVPIEVVVECGGERPVGGVG